MARPARGFQRILMTVNTTISCEFVLVIHGFGGKRILLLPLCRRLRSQGFRVGTWGYLSVLGSVQRHAAKLYEHLKSLPDEPGLLMNLGMALAMAPATEAIMGSLPAAKAYAVRLVRELQATGAPFQRIAYRIDPRQFEGQALLYLPRPALAW